MKEIINTKVYYQFLSPKGIPSDFNTEEEAKEVIKTGFFKVKTCYDWTSMGPSSDCKIKTTRYKIAKILKITFQETKNIEVVYGIF